MSRTITITLPEHLAKQLEILANLEQQSLAETIVAQLDDIALPTDDLAAIEAQLSIVRDFSDCYAPADMMVMMNIDHIVPVATSDAPRINSSTLTLIL